MKRLIYLFSALFILTACGKESFGSEEGSTKNETLGLYDGFGKKQGGSGGQDVPQIKPGQITAGEWSDLKNWNFWTNLEQKQEFSKMSTYWSYNLSTRVSVNLTNLSGSPLPNVAVELLGKNNEILWESATDNLGNTELWGSLRNNQPTAISDLKVRVKNIIFTNIKLFSEGVNNLKANIHSDAVQKKIDIAFMVDATGSMGDELEYLKVELVDIINRVKAKKALATMNIGAVFYRDIGDEYVTRKSEFSTDISKTVNFIKQQKAEGGGDFPEAVHTALKETLKNLQWSTNATSRVVFMVLDAPPHHNAQIVSEMNELIALASRKGVKLVPVVASGIDKETEFLMRYAAIATNGTYVFITNHSGIGNDHLEPTIGKYEVEFLNDLLVRLIDDYLK